MYKRQLLNHAREIGFTSTNIDLIYGLPKQTPESFAFTLQRVAELNPDRLSVFNSVSYTHLDVYKRQDMKLPLNVATETAKQLNLSEGMDAEKAQKR